MRKIIYLIVTMALVAVACSDEDFPFKPGGFFGGDQLVSELTDPALAWSNDSFEATIGAENTFPTLVNKFKVGVTYTSSNPAVATVSSNGSIALVGKGTTMISASSEADGSYSASIASYMLTVLSASGSESDDESLTFSSTGDSESEDDISNTTFKGRIKIAFSDNGDAAVTGDSYGYVSVDGNKVTVNNTGGEVLIYELTGSTSNGFFKVYGAKKQAIVLNGVSITNPDGAALNNQNKKRTFIVVNGTNTLSDGAAAAYAQVGEEDLKAVLFSEAQLIFSGSGLLTVNALNAQGKAGIATDDYIRLMDSPTIKVSSGSSAGHGLSGKDYVQLTSGALVISTEAALKKGISTDDYVLVEGGTHMVTVSGGVAYDDEDAEYSGTAGIKADNYFAMTGGALTIRNTGDGGKGINAGSYDFDAENHTLSDSYISGGTLTVTTTGRESNDVSAKGIKIGWVTKTGSGDRATVTGYAGKLRISGGTVIVNSTYGEGLEVKGDLTFEGGQTYVSSTAEDAINCQGDLTVNGGYVYAYSAGNDAMDSNGNTILNGGYLMAICTCGGAEVAIDANTEEGKKLYINNGATVVAYGGLENGYSATQSVYSMSGTANAWNALFDGKAFIAAFKAPAGISSFIVSAPSLSSGYKGVSVSGETECNGIWATAGITGGTSVAISGYTGGNGGFGGGPGIGGPGGGGPGGPGGR
ncbi:MAG: carbohydrate-binding domain-containing protein [Bacteroidales bacterium]|nr:carbohydrate-binding domain-containing protein [Bacteroidales bacterium]